MRPRLPTGEYTPEGRAAGVGRAREQAERELRRLADVAEHSSDAIIATGRDGRVCRWNRGAERLFGYSEQEALGRTGEELSLPVGDSPVAQNMARALAGEGPFRCEAKRRRKDGAVIDVLATVLPWREQGTVIGLSGVFVDITERKAAEREMERLAQVAEHSSNSVMSFDLDGRIRHFNRGAERISGFRAEEMIGLSIAEWGALSGEGDGLAGQLSPLVDRALAGEVVRYEAQRRRKDGAVIDLQAILTPWLSDGRVVGVTSTAFDVTERKAAERARELALARLEEAQRLARLGSWTWDPQASSAVWSKQSYELFGRDPASGPAVGEELLTYVHADDRERIKELVANPSPGGFEFDFRLLAGHDGQERVLRAIGYPDPGRPACFTGSFQDVSVQRGAERAQAANQAKSEFLSRMSHELRTPLNAISGFAQLLAMDDLEPHQAEHIGYVLKGAEHMLALVNDVLDLSRIEAGQMRVSLEPVALIDTVRDAVALVEPLADAGKVTLSIHPSGLTEGGYVRADAQRLKQVLLNVLSNAIKYNHAGGRVDVLFETPDDSRARMRTLVKDTGMGISAQDIGRLFEPFERLHAGQRAIDGTGLGLALSKGLIEAMGGTITASSTPGVGSMFAIELDGVPTPDAEHARETAEPRHEHPADAGQQPRRSKILYVEDNISNLRLVERVLKRHTTVEMLPAMQGSIGLALAREHHPDVIILDLHLPDISGEVVLARLKADPITQDIPVIVLTADAGKGLARRLNQIGSCEFLSKPLDVPRLLKVIAAYIDSAGHGDARCADHTGPRAPDA